MSGRKYEPTMMKQMSCIPSDPNVFSWVSWGEYIAHTYTNWREETLSWKKSCYISASLSCFPVLTIKGPDAIRFISDISVNSYKKFPVGSCKHMIICNENGLVMDHGMILRTDEDEVQSYITPFYMLYRAQLDHYDITITSTTEEDRPFVFQLAGPRSLEIIENLVQEDLHDLKFMRFRWFEVDGHKVRVLRMGMGGTLSYEVQGFTDDAGVDVYNEIWRIGQEYELKKMGVNQYQCNHTENGFPQSTFHFPGAIAQDPGYAEFMSKIDFYYDEAASEPKGSWSTNIEDFCRNPYELGWGHMVNFDHEFTGKEALMKIKDNHREMVTLVWNPDDLMNVFASYFEQGEEPYEDMPFPHDFGFMGAAENRYLQNKVSKNGKVVGVSMWRTYTLYYRATISLCCIDADQAEIGNEVVVTWGDIGKRQIDIRARVERYPFLDLPPNKDYDMESIPHFVKK